jgi:hypothetical protein
MIVYLLYRSNTKGDLIHIDDIKGDKIDPVLVSIWNHKKIMSFVIDKGVIRFRKSLKKIPRMNSGVLIFAIKKMKMCVVMTEEEICQPQCKNCRKRKADYSKCFNPINVSGFQGGKKEKGEDTYNTAIREVWEESCETIRCTRFELANATQNGHYIDFKGRTKYRLYLLYKKGIKVRNYNRNREKIVKNKGNAAFLETKNMYFVPLDGIAKSMKAKRDWVNTIEGKQIKLRDFFLAIWDNDIVSLFVRTL